MSSGNEDGSRINPNWRPGGDTYPGEIPEAVINQVPADKVSVTNVIGGK
jgi:hypothetical protein